MGNFLQQMAQPAASAAGGTAGFMLGGPAGAAAGSTLGGGAASAMMGSGTENLAQQPNDATAQHRQAIQQLLMALMQSMPQPQPTQMESMTGGAPGGSFPSMRV